MTLLKTIKRVFRSDFRAFFSFERVSEIFFYLYKHGNGRIKDTDNRPRFLRRRVFVQNSATGVLFEQYCKAENIRHENPDGKSYKYHGLSKNRWIFNYDMKPRYQTISSAVLSRNLIAVLRLKYDWRRYILM